MFFHSATSFLFESSFFFGGISLSPASDVAVGAFETEGSDAATAYISAIEANAVEQLWAVGEEERMDGGTVVSEHHFVVTGNDGGEFLLEADSLKPYLVTTGTWAVRVLFLAGGPLPKPEYAGLRITSPFVVTENETSLILAFFSVAEYQKNDNAVFFDVQPTTIVHNTDRLIFRLETLNGQAVNLPIGGRPPILGLALIQLR